MEESDITYTIETEEQLWDELDEVLSHSYAAHDFGSLDDALRRWLDLATKCRQEFSQSEDDVFTCADRLLNSPLFHTDPHYARTQIIYSMLQEDEPASLYAIASFLLLDGRADETTYREMVNEGCFHRLLELMNGYRDDDPRLYRLLLELMYEMPRFERLRPEDLVHVDDGFVAYLFQMTEGLSDDAHDPYNYAIIKVLLILNEQYMVASTAAAADPTSPNALLTNRVVKCLCLYGPQFRTFGENLILLLNRETETSLQLLILKLLYLLFTTKATYEYFYTNDLRVLLDLNQPPYYKEDHIVKVLRIMAGSGNAHFAPADETTLRLVDRVKKVSWLPDDSAGEVANRLLGISLESQDAGSKISVVDVAAVTEKPGVQTPSRKAELSTAEQADDAGAPPSSPEDMVAAASNGGEAASSKEPPPPRKPKKPLPEVPKSRHGKAFAPVVHINANGNGGPAVAAKKLPPQAPPPRRRGRLKAAEPAPAAHKQ
ncbi:phospholipid:diacylglycerol acyltransferase [Apiospora phragmitis]|uniref:Phospholipid:diacylglycerol acyltransferase n=1 Tax=Apiospora phragmitis TaxID=2905665 RepID=A0ABR1VDC9_9PEZI